MKTLFDYLLCCRKTPNDSSAITLNSKSGNEKSSNIVKDTQALAMKTTAEKFQQENTKANPSLKNAFNNNSSSPNNSNSFISCLSQSQSQITAQFKGKCPSNISVENIHIKESNFSLPEVDTEIMIGKELKITGDLFWNRELIIDRLGIKSNKRKRAINNETVFGFSESRDRHGRLVNDLVLNYPLAKEGGESSLFSIKYLKSEEMYEMTMLNRELSIYHLVDYSYFFYSKAEQRFLIGKIMVIVKIDEEEKTIGVVIRDENKEEKKYAFKETDIPIVIGRVHATISVPSSSISKHHAIIDYSDDMQMYYIQDMGSTNKTYKILAKGDRQILKNEMKFKLGETKFEIREFNPK